MSSIASVQLTPSEELARKNRAKRFEGWQESPTSSPLPSPSPSPPLAYRNGSPTLSGNKMKANSFFKLSSVADSTDSASSSSLHFTALSPRAAKKAKTAKYVATASNKVIPKVVWDEEKTAAPVVGTSTALEKDYLRLTSAPDPSTVRPLPVLQRALEHLKTKWLETANYDFAREQLKSIRQDLTVQHLKSDFVVTVYETHGRIALEAGDLDEFGQCQSQLKVLYDQGYAGHDVEFAAYHVLYSCIRTSKMHKTDVNVLAFLQELSKEKREEACVQHACEVRKAILTNDYRAFFQLYRRAPNMSSYLMDFYVDKMRKAALNIICTAYRPSVSVAYLTDLLVFESPSQCVKYLQAEGTIFADPAGDVIGGDDADINEGQDLAVDTKRSLTALTARAAALAQQQKVPQQKKFIPQLASVWQLSDDEGETLQQRIKKKKKKNKPPKQGKGKKKRKKQKHIHED